MLAVIAAVVVLPLVAEIIALPRGRRAPRSPMAFGESLISSLPGALVPPPPRWREIVPTARASASLDAEVPAISCQAWRAGMSPSRRPNPRHRHAEPAS